MAGSKGKKSGRKTPEPPANTEAAALLIREQGVKLYDRQDGKGVDWTVLSTALFKAAFAALDLIGEEDKRQAMAWKVHAGAERRATGGHAVKDDRPPPEFPESLTEIFPSGPGGGQGPARKGPRPPH